MAEQVSSPSYQSINGKRQTISSRPSIQRTQDGRSQEKNRRRTPNRGTVNSNRNSASEPRNMLALPNTCGDHFETTMVHEDERTNQESCRFVRKAGLDP